MHECTFLISRDITHVWRTCILRLETFILQKWHNKVDFKCWWLIKNISRSRQKQIQRNKRHFKANSCVGTHLCITMPASLHYPMLINILVWIKLSIFSWLFISKQHTSRTTFWRTEYLRRLYIIWSRPGRAYTGMWLRSGPKTTMNYHNQAVHNQYLADVLTYTLQYYFENMGNTR